MHDEGRLLVRHLHGVVDGTGNGTGDHAAQAAGGKHRQTQQPGENVGAALSLDDTLVGGGFLINALLVAVGELGVLFTLGTALYYAIKLRRLDKKLF